MTRTFEVTSFSSETPIAVHFEEPDSPLEPDDATVARICRNCEYRWGQA